MSYNPNNPPRPGNFGRKAKRVSDVAALGMAPPPQTYSPPPPFDQNQQMAPPYGGGFEAPSYGFNADPMSSPNYGQYPVGAGAGGGGGGGVGMGMQQAAPLISSFVQNKSQIGAMLQQPMVQDMAVEFGQQLANQGRDMVHQKIEKYVSLNQLKYYFAVDTRYVMKKLFLLFFPFTHKDWSIKYDTDHPVQPRYELNAPDLYIPIMAYVTYIVLSGIILGFQKRFTPEQIGIQASSALAYSIFEIVVYSLTKYIMNIQTRLGIYDMLAFSGYKYVIILAALSTGVVFQSAGYYICLLYCSGALAFFLVRTLKVQILADPMAPNDYSQSVYSQPRHSGSKRKVYFMLLIVLLQPVLSWWLSHHLISYVMPIAPVPNP